MTNNATNQYFHIHCGTTNYSFLEIDIEAVRRFNNLERNVVDGTGFQYNFSIN
jgi:hypothetical protein